MYLIEKRISQVLTFTRNQPDRLNAELVSTCCRFRNSSKDLLTCLNETSIVNNQNIINNIYESRGPSLGVGIVTFATHELWNYSSYTFGVNQAYAEHNGYIFKFFHDSTRYSTTDTRWLKVKVLEEALDPEIGWARDLQYVIWMDADIVIMDMRFRLEQVAAVVYPNAHFLASAGITLNLT